MAEECEVEQMLAALIKTIQGSGGIMLPFRTLVMVGGGAAWACHMTARHYSPSDLIVGLV